MADEPRCVGLGHHVLQQPPLDPHSGRLLARRRGLERSQPRAQFVSHPSLFSFTLALSLLMLCAAVLWTGGCFSWSPLPFQVRRPSSSHTQRRGVSAQLLLPRTGKNDRCLDCSIVRDPPLIEWYPFFSSRGPQYGRRPQQAAGRGFGYDLL
jgi:hypothetical protein